MFSPILLRFFSLSLFSTPRVGVGVERADDVSSSSSSSLTSFVGYCRFECKVARKCRVKTHTLERETERECFLERKHPASSLSLSLSPVNLGYQMRQKSGVRPNEDDDEDKEENG